LRAPRPTASSGRSARAWASPSGTGQCGTAVRADLPQPNAPEDRIVVVSSDNAQGERAELVDVPSTEDDVLGMERVPKPLRDGEPGLSPLLAPEPLQRRLPDVRLVGFALLVREVSE